MRFKWLAVGGFAMWAVVLAAPPAGASGGETVFEAPFPSSPAAPDASPTPTADRAVPPRQPAPVVLRARGPRGERSGETWDFAFAFEGGERLLLRFVLTNLGPGKKNAAAVWHWIEPSGEIVEYDNGQRKNGWSLEDADRVVRIKSSVLDLRRPVLRVSMGKKRAKIDLAIELPAAPLFATTRGDDRFELWATHAVARGSYWRRGTAAPRAIRGTGSLFYSWVRDEAEELRRVEFVSFDPSAKVYATVMLRRNGTQDGWALFETADGAPRVTSDVVACSPADDEYAWPETIVIDAGEVAAVARVEPPFLRYDPLGALPSAIGVLVRWVYEPMRLWSAASLEIDGGKTTSGAVRSTFGNPLGKAARARLDADPRCRTRPRPGASEAKRTDFKFPYRSTADAWPTDGEDKVEPPAFGTAAPAGR